MSALLLLQVRLLLLAALAGEHLLLLGPPGTAKSELSRRMARLTGGTYFERLLTRFSVPEELFGPLSMKGKPHCTCSFALQRHADYRTLQLLNCSIVHASTLMLACLHISTKRFALFTDADAEGNI